MISVQNTRAEVEGVDVVTAVNVGFVAVRVGNGVGIVIHQGYNTVAPARTAERKKRCRYARRIRNRRLVRVHLKEIVSRVGIFLNVGNAAVRRPASVDGGKIIVGKILLRNDGQLRRGRGNDEAARGLVFVQSYRNEIGFAVFL